MGDTLELNSTLSHMERSKNAMKTIFGPSKPDQNRVYDSNFESYEKWIKTPIKTFENWIKTCFEYVIVDSVSKNNGSQVDKTNHFNAL